MQHQQEPQQRKRRNSISSTRKGYQHQPQPAKLSYKPIYSQRQRQNQNRPPIKQDLKMDLVAQEENPMLLQYGIGVCVWSKENKKLRSL